MVYKSLKKSYKRENHKWNSRFHDIQLQRAWRPRRPVFIDPHSRGSNHVGESRPVENVLLPFPHPQLHRGQTAKQFYDSYTNPFWTRVRCILCTLVQWHSPRSSGSSVPHAQMLRNVFYTSFIFAFFPFSGTKLPSGTCNGVKKEIRKRRRAK